MKLSLLRSKVDKIVEWSLIVIVAVMTLNVLWQVFTRFVLQTPSSYTEELARYLLVWLGLLGGAYAVGRKAHLAIDLLPMMMKGKNKLILELVIQVFVLLFAATVILWGGIELVGLTLTLQQVSAALQVKLGYVYLVLPVSGALMIFYSISFIAENIGQLRGDG
ncbi:MAG: TRAP transporter small permease [Bacteroidetes bacterium]|nr:TRAP transporter small permease [Bacteroidota bacterium]MCW5894127.1 TRAP transporter small permease [Bacteroidota bacterium]